MTLSARNFPKGVTVGFELVTPAIAQEWLDDFNSHNRNLSDRQVAKYASDMAEDRWLINGETIQFDWDGILANGQHRLNSLVKAGVSLWLLVVRGLPPKAQKTIDGGRPRRAGDVLFLEGYPNSTALGASARLAMHLSTPALKVDFTNAEIEAFVEANPGLVKVADMTLPRVPLSPSVKMYTYWKITEASPVEGPEFFELLASLANLPANSPILTLNKRLVNYVRSGDSWAQRQELVALTFRAYNAWRAGETLAKLPIPRGAGGKVAIPELVRR